MQKDTNFYYKYETEKKIDANTTRMANVQVFDFNDKKIGCETVSKWQDPEQVVGMIIREYQISKAWNKKY